MRYRDLCDQEPEPNHPLNSFTMKAMFGLPRLPPRHTTPHPVECRGLTREAVGDQEFEHEFWRRKHWLDEHCQQPYAIEGLYDAGRLIGRRYLFASEPEAIWFKLKFPVRLV